MIAITRNENLSKWLEHQTNLLFESVFEMVEILLHYSNTSELLSDLRRTCQIVTETNTQDRDEHDISYHNTYRIWRLQERLSEADVQTIIKDFSAGTPKRELAARYKISVTSVRRVLQQHGIRRRSRYDRLG